MLITGNIEEDELENSLVKIPVKITTDIYKTGEQVIQLHKISVNFIS